jgi:O-antigen ligase
MGLNLLLFPIVYTAVWTQRRAQWVVGAFVLGALASAAYGAVDPAVDTEARLTGARFEPNELAAVLVAAVALSLALAGAARGVAARAAAIAAAAVCTAAIMFTLSRAGLVALGVVLVAGLVIAARRRGPALLVALVVALGVVTYFGFVAPDAARERVTTVESGTGRLDLWQVGWRMVEDEPLTGVGAGNYEVASVHYLLEPGEVERSDFIVDNPKVTHNVYLQMAAELGVVGLALFLAIAATSVASGVAAMRRFATVDDRIGAAIARGAVLATIGLLAADFFASGQFSNQLWFLLALSPALLGVALRSDRGAAPG